MNESDHYIRRIPDDLWRKVRAAAALDDLQIREFVIKALEEALAKRG